MLSLVANSYQPFWCEENIWHLAQHPSVTASRAEVLILTGATAQVACWHQLAGDAEQPIFWDYHVVLATRADDPGPAQLWDLDSRLGYPVPAASWLGTTFPHPELVPERFQPRFAVIPAEDYVRRFGSDRAHMLDAKSGRWMHPPPPWPELKGKGLTLADAIDEARHGLDLTALTARLLQT